ncbi:MAG: ATP-binding protein [Candidatus Dormiibacter spiritus]|nr:MAG: ATP-binding protein [Candidatus Dormibacteraeota bacterium]
MQRVKEAFVKEVQSGYSLTEPSLVIGSALLDGEPLTDPRIQVALTVLNRHGLVAGATGTGKTKTLQVLAGQLSDAGVPVFVADIKGDLTGLAAPGDASSAKLQERCQQMAWEFKPAGHAVDFLSLTGKVGAQVRATVHSFGPTLFGKVLGLNETQTSILAMVFKYCDDNQLPLLDLPDLRTTLQYLTSDAGKPELAQYGGIAAASVGVLLRALATFEQEGAGAFFGEPEFDVQDLIRTDTSGKGLISLLELSDVLEKPKLFSTFMLWMLAQLWNLLPEIGDPPKPKLVFFFDEAHLLFDGASKALLAEIERTVRLIRSKGVGIYFVTQVPGDVPSSVLAQLGNRVQHALRAFTPQDADALRKAARTFPKSDFYDTEKLLTSLGTGEAAVTVLSPKGVPTPLAATRLIPPDSLMDALDAVTVQRLISVSPLTAKYATPIDPESAHEIITARIQAAQEEAAAAAAQAETKPRPLTAAEQVRMERQAAAEKARAERERVAAERQKQRMLETGVRTAGRVVTSRAGQDLIRGVFGTLFGGKR